MVNTTPTFASRSCSSTSAGAASGLMNTAPRPSLAAMPTRNAGELGTRSAERFPLSARKQARQYHASNRHLTGGENARNSRIPKYELTAPCFMRSLTRFASLAGLHHVRGGAWMVHAAGQCSGSTNGGSIPSRAGCSFDLVHGPRPH